MVKRLISSEHSCLLKEIRSISSNWVGISFFEVAHVFQRKYLLLLITAISWNLTCSISSVLILRIDFTLDFPFRSAFYIVSISIIKWKQPARGRVLGIWNLHSALKWEIPIEFLTQFWPVRLKKNWTSSDCKQIEQGMFHVRGEAVYKNRTEQ